ncbi:MAG: hypothetical protein KME20_12380 [Kaiparowitsia implicata GSE-PSE-MK54-09C]|jgi:Mn2+/Fe2+ NRAMP family transporter|nr:hypothetical protein [Kaiparowitsia implicata GSE-PSE-MK54-09C]
MFSVVLLAATLSSVIGATCTSVSFMYLLHPAIRTHNQQVVITFIACSTLIYSLIGQPVKVLIVAGALNALVLPLALGGILWAAKKPNIVGNEYWHPHWMPVATAVALLSHSMHCCNSGNHKVLMALLIPRKLVGDVRVCRC